MAATMIFECKSPDDQTSKSKFLFDFHKGIIVTFVNEYISQENIEKYRIKKWDELFYIAHYKPTWTVDYEDGTYLRYVGSGHEDDANRWFFHFHWSSADFSVQVILLDDPNHSKETPCRRYRLESLCIPFRDPLPNELEKLHQEILFALKNALIAFGDGGVHSIAKNLFISFEF